MLTDLRFAVRQLLKNPGFAAVAALTLALGIGANTTALEHPGPGVVSITGARAWNEISVQGVKLCWCPPGKFVMGSPRTEPERRPGEDQVEVVSFEAAARRRSRLVFRAVHGGIEPDGRLVPRAPWRGLDGRRLAIADGLSSAIRTTSAPRPHWLPRSTCPTLRRASLSTLT